MMYDFITQTSVLLTLFAIFLAISIGFQFWKPLVGGTFLDSVASVPEVQNLLVKMSSAQKDSHFLMTLLLDMLYPLVYGSLFAGLTLRVFGSHVSWLSIPAFIVIPVDLAENVIQLIALKGNEVLLPLKAVLTPVKFALFYVAGVIALVALAYAVFGFYSYNYKILGLSGDHHGNEFNIGGCLS